MVRIGVVGMGFIGQQHFSTWANVEGAQVVAVADKVPERVAAQAAAIGGNIGEAPPLDLEGVARYTSLADMLAAGGIDAVDLCLPTPEHSALTEEAMAGGVHVICEKPMARNVEECDQMLAAAEKYGKMLFIAQCIRFWPEYEVLAKMLKDGNLGRLVSLKLTRLSATPTWSEGGWLADVSKSGGSMLDLHIHDVDFITSILGMPKAVFSRAGTVCPGGEKVDEVITQYMFDDDAVVFAEGGWGFPATYPFEMAFEALGEKACLRFSTARTPMLTWHPVQGELSTPQYRETTGYQQELEYFAQCIAAGTPPTRVTAFEAREAVRLVHAEKQSVATGAIVSL